MSIHPTQLKKLWQLQQHEDIRRKLEPFKLLDTKPRHFGDTDYAEAMFVSDKDRNLDEDLQGMGNSSLGAGISDTQRPSY